MMVYLLSVFFIVGFCYLVLSTILFSYQCTIYSNGTIYLQCEDLRHLTPPKIKLNNKIKINMIILFVHFYGSERVLSALLVHDHGFPVHIYSCLLYTHFFTTLSC